MTDVAAILAAHHADRLANTPSIFVHGPGCAIGGRGFVASDRRYAVKMCDRLNAEYGAGTHRIVG